MTTTDDEYGSLELVIRTVVDDWLDRYCRYLYGSAAGEDLKHSLEAQIKLLGGFTDE